jgi:4-amino-4-deoxy-L-arabinose transferase-like glycosyltransferase
VATTVAFLSLSSGKRSVYLLPIFPGLALLLAQAFSRLDPARRHRLATSWPLWLLALVATAGSLALFVLPEIRSHRLPPETESIGAAAVSVLAVWLAGLAAAAAVAGLLARRNERRLAAMATVAGAMALLGPVGLGWIAPRADAFKSARPVADKLRRDLAPGESWGSFREAEAGVLFYLEQSPVVLPDEAALRRFVERGEGAWVVADRDDLSAVSEPFPYQEVVGSGREKGGLVLLRVRPEAMP